MATIINNPPSVEKEAGSGIGIIIGIIIAAIAAFLLYMYVLPMLQTSEAPPPADRVELQVPVPATTIETE